MKKAAKAAKAVNGKKASRKAGKSTRTKIPTDSERIRTVADSINDIIFGDDTDAESKMEKLEVWRGRHADINENIFQQDVLRLVRTAITSRPVEVYLPIRLSALEWQRLIATGIDEAREWIIVNSSNKVNDQWKVPECGAEGVLARMIVHSIRNAARFVKTKVEGENGPLYEMVN